MWKDPSQVLASVPRLLTQRRTLIYMLVGLFFISFAVRAVYLVEVTGIDWPLEGDEGAYHGIATGFVDGEGWGTEGGKSERAPLLSFLLSGVYLLTGNSTSAARWAVVLFSSLVAPVLLLTVYRLVGRSDVALLVAGAWVLYPPSIWYSGRILTETTSALLVVGSLGAYLWAAKGHGGWSVLVAGALFGLLALNRATYLFLPFAFLLAQVALSMFGAVEWSWSRREWVVGLAAFAVVMTPWTVRNYIEHGVFLPHTTQGGELLLITNGTLESPLIREGRYFKNPELRRQVGLESETEVERDSVSRRLALEEMRRNWHLLPEAVLNRAKNFWTTRPDPYDSTWTTNDWIMLAIWCPTLALFAVSSFVRSWRHYWPALWIILYAFLFTLPFWGTPRFRFPVDALIVTGAAVGFLEVSGLAWSIFVRRYRQARMSI